MPPVRFSFWANASQPWEGVLEEAAHAASTGWDGVWVSDHFFTNDGSRDRSPHEAWTLLAALAVAVPRVRLGVLVSGNTYRHPAVLTKQAATVDHVSGGRVVLGLGAGWQAFEHRAFGIELPPPAVRVRMLEEACRVVKGLTRQDSLDLDGTYYRLDGAFLAPAPLQRPIPLLVGGAGERHTMRIAATYADEWNTWGTPETMAAKRAVLERHCETVGRDPATLLVSCQAVFTLQGADGPAPGRAPGAGFPKVEGTAAELVEAIGRYSDAGVGEVIVPHFSLGSGPERLDALERFRTDVIDASRA